LQCTVGINIYMIDTLVDNYNADFDSI
jgi:hypothetical protein